MSLNFFHLLLLIIIANGAPVILRAVLNTRMGWPIDFGYRLPDGGPLFGNSKTWRGLAASLLATAPAAVILGYAPETGVLVAVYAMAGDVFSSFIKRRLGLAPHSMAPLLDQVPESLFPAVMLRHTFGMDTVAIIILVAAFVVAELLLSLVLFKLGIRKKPY